MGVTTRVKNWKQRWCLNPFWLLLQRFWFFVCQPFFSFLSPIYALLLCFVSSFSSAFLSSSYSSHFNSPLSVTWLSTYILILQSIFILTSYSLLPPSSPLGCCLSGQQIHPTCISSLRLLRADCPGFPFALMCRTKDRQRSLSEFVYRTRPLWRFLCTNPSL